MSSFSSPTSTHNDYLADLQDRPLLPHRLKPLHPFCFKFKALIGSKLVTYTTIIIVMTLVVFIDRHVIRNLQDPELLWETNYHLTNSMVSHVCNLIPSSYNQSFPGLLNNKFCSEQRKQLKFVKAAYLPETGHDFGITMNRQLDSERCQALFPNLYHELDRAVAHHSSRGNITIQQLDQASPHGHARVLIYRNRVYIKEFNGGPGKRTEAALNSIQEAVITSPELIPDIEFVIKTADAPLGEDKQLPLWVLDRTKSQEDVWLMPDYGFYSWPEPKVGGMIEVRDKTAQKEASLSWSKKIPKAFWRGAILVKIREQLLELSKGHAWSDIAPINWQSLNGGLTTPEDHCNYQFLIHVEGYAYSGRLKYLQMCRSVVVAHDLQYIQHFHHLLDSRPHSPTQNIAMVEGPGFEGLPKLMNELREDDRWAQSIANNSYPLFRHYLSPAGVHCYWRQMFKSWAKVQAFVPERKPEDLPFESFNLMHTLTWDPY